MSKAVCECIFPIPLFYIIFVIVFTESQTKKVPYRPPNNFNFMDGATESQTKKTI